MNKATKLLRNCYTLQEIAEQIDYDSVLTFSKAFKKSRGLSPSAYLASIQANRLVEILYHKELESSVRSSS